MKLPYGPRPALLRAQSTANDLRIGDILYAAGDLPGSVSPIVVMSLGVRWVIMSRQVGGQSLRPVFSLAEVDEMLLAGLWLTAESDYL